MRDRDTGVPDSSGAEMQDNLRIPFISRRHALQLAALGLGAIGAPTLLVASP
jgi:hypothetical protein